MIHYRASRHCLEDCAMHVSHHSARAHTLKKHDRCSRHFISFRDAPHPHYRSPSTDSHSFAKALIELIRSEVCDVVPLHSFAQGRDALHCVPSCFRSRLQKLPSYCYPDYKISCLACNRLRKRTSPPTHLENHSLRLSSAIICQANESLVILVSAEPARFA